MQQHRAISTVTPAASEPVSLDVAKSHLRVDHNDEDALIGSHISAARRYVEEYTGLAVASKTVDVVYDGFPDGDLIVPMPPLQSVAEIAYYAAGEDSATVLSSDDYIVVSVMVPSLVALVEGRAWPATAGRVDAVRVRATVGPGVGQVPPETVTQAMLLLIGHWYENREDASEMKLQSIPRGVQHLLQMEKIRYG